MKVILFSSRGQAGLSRISPGPFFPGKVPSNHLRARPVVPQFAEISVKIGLVSYDFGRDAGKKKKKLSKTSKEGGNPAIK